MRLQDLELQAVTLGVLRLHARQIGREERGLVPPGTGPDLDQDILVVPGVPRDEHRPGEAAAQKLAPLLSPLLMGPLAKYQPVKTSAVAAEMIRLAKQDRHGAFVHHLG